MNRVKINWLAWDNWELCNLINKIRNIKGNNKLIIEDKLNRMMRSKYILKRIKINKSSWKYQKIKK